MKVIIADDEIHIGALVKHLVDWEGLNLTLAGVFGSGADVLLQMEKDPADIVICDVEMPGIDGIELIGQLSKKYPFCKCIVISGFRNFEYARSAMKYGVTNYLLKPIDGEELNQALQAAVTAIKKDEQPADETDGRTTRLQLADLFSSQPQPLALGEVNKKYKYQFKEGIFNIFKIIFTGEKMDSEFLPRIMKLFEDFINPKLAQLCYEKESFRASQVSLYILVNYSGDMDIKLSAVNGEHEEKGSQHSLFDSILRTALMEMEAKAECSCYIGVGVPVKNLYHINTSYHSAQFAVCGRMTAAGRRIFYADFCDYDRRSKDTVNVSEEERQQFQRIVEQIDEKGVKGWVDKCFQARETLFFGNPYLMTVFGNKIIELAMTSFEELGAPIADRISFRKNAAVTFDSSDTERKLKEKISAIIAGEIGSRLSAKLKNAVPYVQQAKNYIEKNYAKAVTLELIADELHINPVYLSILFKNETEMNYSKYLSAVRIEKAKILLRKCDKNLTQISNAVGYDSVQYFNSLFKKTTGLKPSEYRRLHQNEE